MDAKQAVIYALKNNCTHDVIKYHHLISPLDIIIPCGYIYLNDLYCMLETINLYQYIVLNDNIDLYRLYEHDMERGYLNEYISIHMHKRNIMKYIINKHTSVDDAIYHYITRNQEQVVHWLLHNNYKYNDEYTYYNKRDQCDFLSRAILNCNLHMVKFLTQYCRGLTHKLTDDGRTRLWKCCDAGNVEILQYMIDIGVDANHEDVSGMTVLEYYITRSDLNHSVLKVLSSSSSLHVCKKALLYYRLHGDNDGEVISILN